MKLTVDTKEKYNILVNILTHSIAISSQAITRLKLDIISFGERENDASNMRMMQTAVDTAEEMLTELSTSKFNTKKQKVASTEAALENARKLAN